MYHVAQNSWNRKKQIGLGALGISRAHGKRLWKLEEGVSYDLMRNIDRRGIDWLIYIIIIQENKLDVSNSKRGCQLLISFVSAALYCV